jgi:hypothetical protein
MSATSAELRRMIEEALACVGWLVVVVVLLLGVGICLGTRRKGGR